jgi:hypothetical protein
MRKTILLLSLILLFTGAAVAQGDTDYGLWNEIQVTKPINKEVSVTFGTRIESKQVVEKLQENRYYVNLNIQRGKWTFMPSYIFLGSAGKSGWYWEHRPSFTINRKFTAPKSKWTVTVGSRNEYRIRPKKNDFRFVPNIAIERKINDKYKAFQRTEFWVDTRKADPTQYRTRFFFGINRTLTKNLNVDIFYLYQRDQKFDPKDVHKIGFLWKYRFN